MHGALALRSCLVEHALLPCALWREQVTWDRATLPPVRQRLQNLDTKVLIFDQCPCDIAVQSFQLRP